MPTYEADGTELTPPTEDQLVKVCELGGQFERFSFYVEFRSKSLDRKIISECLGLTPTRSWNAGEPHPVGKAELGRMRVLDYGKWSLRVDVDNEQASTVIVDFFAQCTASIDTWKRLSKDFDGCIALVGHTSNWNREFFLTAVATAAIAERGLGIWLDAYFETQEDALQQA